MSKVAMQHFAPAVPLFSLGFVMWVEDWIIISVDVDVYCKIFPAIRNTNSSNFLLWN